MSETKIEWTDRTWNPVRGCSRVSEGCRNCYAERTAARFSGKGQPFHGFAALAGSGRPMPGVRSMLAPRWTGKVELIESKLREPLSWRKPSRVFVNSMSDLFHEALPDSSIDEVLAIVRSARRHTFQVLTKRPERMLRYWQEIGRIGGDVAPIPNLWLGVSVEDQATADERIPLLLQTPAAVRFVSAEPLIGPVDLMWLRVHEGNLNALAGWRSDDFEKSGVPREKTECLDWIIVGGESGPGARPCNVEWVRSIVEQTKAAGVPCFVKQVGAVPWAPNDRVYLDGDPASWPDDTAIEDPATRATHQGEPCRIYLRDRKGGDPAEWPEDLRVREFPEEAS